MNKLFSSFSLKSVSFRNRLVVSPMCQYSAEEGFANNWHLVHLGSRAVGGAGLVMQEATAVSPEGRISGGDLGIWQDGHQEKLKEIVRFVQAQGARIGIQLAHAGRKASCHVPWEGGAQIAPDAPGGWQTIAPSAIPYKPQDAPPAVLSEESIRGVVGDFAAAAQRAKDVGYDVLEIHAAHGYLIHQFLSPVSNRRADHYGGSFENRIRLLMEVLDQAMPVWGEEKPVFVRISATDWVGDGWDIEESIRLCRLLRTKGVDLIDVSSGGNVLTKIPVHTTYQTDLAKEIKSKTGMATGAVGLITDAQLAEEILEGDGADLIFIARQSLRDPYFGLHASQELGEPMDFPIQYQRAAPKA